MVSQSKSICQTSFPWIFTEKEFISLIKVMSSRKVTTWEFILIKTFTKTHQHNHPSRHFFTLFISSIKLITFWRGKKESFLKPTAVYNSKLFFVHFSFAMYQNTVLMLLVDWYQDINCRMSFLLENFVLEFFFPIEPKSHDWSMTTRCDIKIISSYFTLSVFIRWRSQSEMQKVIETYLWCFSDTSAAPFTSNRRHVLQYKITFHVQNKKKTFCWLPSISSDIMSLQWCCSRCFHNIC